MLIDIVGWHDKHNAGDEAFKLGFETFFHKHKLNYVTPPTIANRGEIVVLGGGAVVSPYYLNSIPRDNRPLFALGVGIAYESEIDLMVDRNFKYVMVRNGSDVEAIKAKLSCPVVGMPDLAFLHRCGYNLAPEPKTAVILVTDYINPAIDRPTKEFANTAFDFNQKMAKICDKLINDDWRLTFLPCSTGGYGDDRRAALEIMAFMKHPYTDVVNVMETKSPEEMIDIIASHSLAINMRFHAHIFSMIAGTPFVSIGLTRKVDLLLKENNLLETRGGWMENGLFHDRHMMDVIQNVVANSDEYRKRFEKKTDENFKSLIATGQLIGQYWH